MPPTTRRQTLDCMAWGGLALLWTVTGGIPQSRLVTAAEAKPASAPTLSFLQISDSHIGFHAPPNPTPDATLQEAIARLNTQKQNAAFLIHTGDVSQLSKPAQFDTADQIIRQANLTTHYVPGEHDVLIDSGAAFFARITRVPHQSPLAITDTPLEA